MDDNPPPVPPKDSPRSPASSANRIARRRVPAPLSDPRTHPDGQAQATHLTVGRHQAASYTSYTYPPSSYGALVEPASAPSTRTEFAEVDRSPPRRQRGSELLLSTEELTPRALNFHKPSSPAEYGRTGSTLRRSVSNYTAADYSPSVYTPTFHSRSPSSTLDLSRAQTFRSQSTWAGPSPISPADSREHWRESSYQPLRVDNSRSGAWTASEEPFEDASEFHLFAEATAGLGPLLDTSNGQRQGSVVSPIAARSISAGHDPQYLSHGTHTPRNVSVPPPLPREYYAPLIVPRPMQRRQTHSQGRSREAQELSEAFAEALTGFGPEGEVGPEDELPDYAQSQHEAQQRQRRAAAQRAQELEQRWAKARRAAQARGQ